MACVIVESGEHWVSGREGSPLRSGFYPFAFFFVGYVLKMALSNEIPKQLEFLRTHAYFIFYITFFIAVTEIVIYIEPERYHLNYR